MQHIGRDNRSKLDTDQQSDWNNAKRRQKDLDATHTPKHGKGYFGYKLSVSVDHKHGFIRGVATGTAREHDGHYFAEVLDMNNTGKQVQKELPSRGLHISKERVSKLMKRKATTTRTPTSKPVVACVMHAVELLNTCCSTTQPRSAHSQAPLMRRTLQHRLLHKCRRHAPSDLA